MRELGQARVAKLKQLEKSVQLIEKTLNLPYAEWTRYQEVELNPATAQNPQQKQYCDLEVLQW